jgi:hypothetical protein
LQRQLPQVPQHAHTPHACTLMRPAGV